MLESEKSEPILEESTPSEVEFQEAHPEETSPSSALPDVQEEPEFIIAGFWRRVAAFIIDMTIIGIPLLIFGFAFSRLTFRMGPWGRFLGFGLMLVYWTLMSTTAQHGQTIGKKVLKTAVVDRNGRYLPASKAFLRSFILVLIFLLNGLSIPFPQWPIITIALSIIVFGGSLAMMYGLIFNRTTRQGIHDLFARTYVIKTPPAVDIEAPVLPKIHRNMMVGLVALVTLLSVIAAFIPTNFDFGPIKSEEFKELSQLQADLQDDAFFSVNVTKTAHYEWGSPDAVTILEIQAWSKDHCQENRTVCQNHQEQIAKTALETKEDIDSYTAMRITIYNRFDLGFATGHINTVVAAPIDEWRQAVGDE